MAEYKPNWAELEKLTRSPAAEAALVQKMLPVKARAELLTPVRTGQTKASYRIRSGVRDGRAYARLVNLVPWFRFLEFGTKYIRKMRILGRALDAARD